MSTQSAAQVVVVTGASGGIGAATARAFAGAGWTVVGTSRDAAAAHLDGVEMRDLDVTDPAAVERFVSGVLADHGGVDVLVNNAGIGAIGSAEDTDVEVLERVLAVNLTGLVRLTRAFLGPMRERGTGRVVNVSSAVGLVPAPFMAAYAASKHAVEGWSVSADHETREHGVRVLLVEPGYTDTGFDAAVLRPTGTSGAYDRRVAALEDVLTGSLRSGDAPEVVARTILAAATSPAWTARFPAGRLARASALGYRFAPRVLFDVGLRRVTRLPLRLR